MRTAQQRPTVKQASPRFMKRPAAKQPVTVRKKPAKGMAKKRPAKAHSCIFDGYTGCKDSDGLPHGHGICASIDGTYEGQFVHGARQGDGQLRFADGSICRGQFHANMPHGRCEYFDPEDKTIMTGTYVNGELHGPASQVDEAGRLIFRGCFAHDVRIGVAEVFDEYGGRVVGQVDDEGDHTGDNIMYIFPDDRTVLVGTFEDSQFCSGFYATLVEAPKPRDDVGTSDVGSKSAIPIIALSTRVPDRVCRDVSTDEVLCRQPLVPDLYELDRVEVKESNINGQMDGLFARTHIKAGEYCSWYNGLRCTHDEVNARGWEKAQATITLDDTVVLDIPGEYNSTSQFCACLGHKANHSLPNNAKYDVFDHPRFGFVKAIRAVRDIEPGEEICCDYGYEGSPEDLPDWYKGSPAG